MKVRKALSLLLLLVLASTLIPSAKASPPGQGGDREEAESRMREMLRDHNSFLQLVDQGKGGTKEAQQAFAAYDSARIRFCDCVAAAAMIDEADEETRKAWEEYQRRRAQGRTDEVHGVGEGGPSVSISELLSDGEDTIESTHVAFCLTTPPPGYGLIGGAIQDSDGDGVPDDIDQCRGTLAGVAVDEKGCPVAAGPTETPGQKAALGKTPSLTTTSPDAAAKGPTEAIGDLLSGYSLNVPQSIAQLTGEIPSIGANLGLGTDINDPGQIVKTLDWGQKTMSDIYTAIDLVNTIANFTPYGKVVGEAADSIKGAGQPLKDFLDKKKNYNDSLKTLNQDPRFQSMSDDEKAIRAEIMAEIKSKVSKALGDAVPSVGAADAIMTGLSHLQPEYSKVTMDHDVGGQKIAIDTDFSHWTSGHVINSAVDHGSTSTWNDLAGVVQTQWTDVRDADGVLAKAAHVGKAAAVTTYTTGVAVVKVAVDGASFVADKAHKAWQGLKGLF